MRIVIIVALAMLSGCAHQDEWTRQDTTLQLIYTGTLVVDAIQTSEIQYHDNLVEGGPIARQVLGRNPSTSDTWQYFTTVAISHWLISRALPEKWRPYWQGAGIATQVPVIINNCAHGLGGPCHED